MDTEDADQPVAQRRRNQYNPNPPLELCRKTIETGWDQKLNDKQILAELRPIIEREGYGLGITRFREYRERLGYFRPRKSGWTATNIGEAMTRLRNIYPKAGARDIISLLIAEENMAVARSAVEEWFKLHEPHLLAQRRANHFRRLIFYCAGPYDMICVDQHDKWKYKFNLALHNGVEPFSGRILWINIWHNNSSSKLILSYYLDWVESFGHMPLITQSDPGSENFGIANGHTALRHLHDEDMHGTLCHRWMREKKNIKPEIAWSQLRRRFTPGFENILEKGVQEGWYDPANTLENLTFRWVFIPWLQLELNAYIRRINTFRKRHDKNKVLPQGVPDFIAEHPERFGAVDFKIKVQPEHLETVRREYIPDRDTNPVFQLVPADFDVLATELYIAMLPPNGPVINRETAWDVYKTLLGSIRDALQQQFEQSSSNSHSTTSEYNKRFEAWKEAATLSHETGPAAPQEVTPDKEHDRGLQPLASGREVGNGMVYMGGVNRGQGLTDEELADIVQQDGRQQREVARNVLPRGVVFTEDQQRLQREMEDAEQREIDDQFGGMIDYRRAPINFLY